MRYCILLGLCCVFVTNATAVGGEIVGASAYGSALSGAEGELVLSFGQWDARDNDNSDNPYRWGLGYNTRAYDDQLVYQAVEPIDVVLEVQADEGVREHEFIADVYNSSNAAWGGFRLLIGAGTGDGFTPVRAGDLDGLDFDTPDRDKTPAAVNFTAVRHDPTVLIFGQNTVLPKQRESFKFFIDVPDGPNGGDYEFTLRHEPIPEPTAGGMWVVMLLLGGWRGRRRRG